ncbi:hypothetical protein LSH36_220g00023 [Paralvinella palmiformis]|uniref:Uncharacterized protein n=1 Tax=Paralvinella palmiformis TaxID=53620 RepID=A0AAD9JNT1_9ANNE|nr:hypothetical protein LSH36_220g00023 [Paralvinella palmiformis]
MTSEVVSRKVVIDESFTKQYVDTDLSDGRKPVLDECDIERFVPEKDLTKEIVTDQTFNDEYISRERIDNIQFVNGVKIESSRYNTEKPFAGNESVTKYAKDLSLSEETDSEEFDINKNYNKKDELVDEQHSQKEIDLSQPISEKCHSSESLTNGAVVDEEPDTENAIIGRDVCQEETHVTGKRNTWKRNIRHAFKHVYKKVQRSPLFSKNEKIREYLSEKLGDGKELLTEFVGDECDIGEGVEELFPADETFEENEDSEEPDSEKELEDQRDKPVSKRHVKRELPREGSVKEKDVTVMCSRDETFTKKKVVEDYSADRLVAKKVTVKEHYVASKFVRSQSDKDQILSEKDLGGTFTTEHLFVKECISSESVGDGNVIIEESTAKEPRTLAVVIPDSKKSVQTQAVREFVRVESPEVNDTYECYSEKDLSKELHTEKPFVKECISNESVSEVVIVKESISKEPKTLAVIHNSMKTIQTQTDGNVIVKESAAKEPRTLAVVIPDSKKSIQTQAVREFVQIESPEKTDTYDSDTEIDLSKELHTEKPFVKECISNESVSEVVIVKESISKEPKTLAVIHNSMKTIQTQTDREPNVESSTEKDVLGECGLEETFAGKEICIESVIDKDVVERGVDPKNPITGQSSEREVDREKSVTTDKKTDELVMDETVSGKSETMKYTMRQTMTSEVVSRKVVIDESFTKQYVDTDLSDGRKPVLDECDIERFVPEKDLTKEIVTDQTFNDEYISRERIDNIQFVNGVKIESSRYNTEKPFAGNESVTKYAKDLSLSEETDSEEFDINKNYNKKDELVDEQHSQKEIDLSQPISEKCHSSESLTNGAVVDEEPDTENAIIGRDVCQEETHVTGKRNTWKRNIRHAFKHVYKKVQRSPLFSKNEKIREYLSEKLGDGKELLTEFVGDECDIGEGVEELFPADETFEENEDSEEPDSEKELEDQRDKEKPVSKRHVKRELPREGSVKEKDVTVMCSRDETFTKKKVVEDYSADRLVPKKVTVKEHYVASKVIHSQSDKDQILSEKDLDETSGVVIPEMHTTEQPFTYKHLSEEPVLKSESISTVHEAPQWGNDISSHEHYDVGTDNVIIVPGLRVKNVHITVPGRNLNNLQERGCLSKKEVNEPVTKTHSSEQPFTEKIICRELDLDKPFTGEHTSQEPITGETFTCRKYQKDYDLGNSVTIKNVSLEPTADKRVSKSLDTKAGQTFFTNQRHREHTMPFPIYHKHTSRKITGSGFQRKNNLGHPIIGKHIPLVISGSVTERCVHKEPGTKQLMIGNLVYIGGLQRDYDLDQPFTGKHVSREFVREEHLTGHLADKSSPGNEDVSRRKEFYSFTENESESSPFYLKKYKHINDESGTTVEDPGLRLEDADINAMGVKHDFSEPPNGDYISRQFAAEESITDKGILGECPSCQVFTNDQISGKSITHEVFAERNIQGEFLLEKSINQEYVSDRPGSGETVTNSFQKNIDIGCPITTKYLPIKYNTDEHPDNRYADNKSAIKQLKIGSLDNSLISSRDFHREYDLEQPFIGNHVYGRKKPDLSKMDRSTTYKPSRDKHSYALKNNKWNTVQKKYHVRHVTLLSNGRNLSGDYLPASHVSKRELQGIPNRQQTVV